MLVIRYQRTGKKNQPSFRIVVTDRRKSSRGGRFVEILGFRNPLTKKSNIKKERIQYWLSKGAKPSDSIHNLLVEAKIIEGKKVPTHSKKKVKGPAESSAAAKQSGGPATISPEASLGGETKPAEAPKEEAKPAVEIAETTKPAAEPEKPTEPAASAPVEPKPTEPEKAPEEKKEA